MPWQTGLSDAEIDTDTGNRGFTVMETGLDVAGLPVTQTALEVILQVTTSPFTGVNEYVVPPGPVDIPFTNHSNTGLEPPLTGMAVKVT